MLQLIRKRVTGFIAWVVFGFIAIAFTLWGANGFIFSKSSNDIAAKVAGHKIPWITIDKLVQRQMLANPSLQTNVKQAREQVRKLFVDDYAFNLQLKKKGFVVNDSLIVSSIFSQSQFFENGKFSMDKYHNLLAQNGLSDVQYQSQLRDALLEQQPKMAILSTSFMLGKEFDELNSIINQTRDINYAVISADKFAAEEVSSEDIESYYNLHKKEFTLPEQVKIEYVVLGPEAVSNNVDVNEEKLISFYNDHLSDYSIPEMVRVKHIFIKSPEGSNTRTSGEAEEKANDIMAKLKLKEKDFDALMVEYSEDNSSSDGDLGWIRRGEVDPSFEKAAFSIENVGDYSTEVVASPFGFHILSLSEKRSAIAKSFADVKGEVERRFVEESSQGMILDLVDEVANIAFENQHENIDVIAKSTGLKIETATLTNNSKLFDKISVSKEIFSDGGLKDSRIISEPLKVKENNYIVLKVVDVIPAKEKDLEQVKDEIVSSLVDSNLKDQVKAYTQEVVKSFENDKEPFRLLGEKEIEWKPFNNLGRGSTELNKEIIDSVFSVSEYSENKVHSNSLPGGDYLVFNIVSINPGKFEDSVNAMGQTFDRDKMLEAMSSNNGATEYKVYKESLINNTSIKLYD